MRNAEITRNTAETQIQLTLNIDGQGKYTNNTGCGFLNHMLDLMAKNAGFDLTITCKGDTQVDYHHTVEDVGIALGAALAKAIGNCTGITRYGHIILPMDEVLMVCALDFSGRAALGFDAEFATQKIGEFDTELVREFMLALSREAKLTLHFKQLSGGNAHHTAEAMFKALGRSLRMAASIDTRFATQIPSTKGVL